MKSRKNFMDYIPIYNPQYKWDADSEGIVTVHVVNKGFYNRIAQKLFNKPRVSHIALDEYGSFVWYQMDGTRDVFEIAKLVKEKYGDRAEPVVGRLVRYIQILYHNKFIGYLKQQAMLHS